MLGIIEVIFRLNFEEFKNHIHSPQKTLGKNHYFLDFFGFKSRTSKSLKDQSLKMNKELVLVLGDSISAGYGHAYHDIWSVQLQRILQIKEKTYDFKAVTGFGNNFTDNLLNGQKLIRKLEKKNIKPYKVIYQFNFNHIHSFNRENLATKTKPLFTKFSFARWRYQYLNKSVFARVIQHYAGILHRKTSGTCKERGFDALGEYTWTFGSKFVEAESLEIWKKFDESISEFTNYLKKKNIKFEILIAPILFQIDKTGKHPYFNHINLDFSCATIDPISRLNDIKIKHNIKIYDPTKYVRLMFNNRVEDNNFEPFFFAGDTNHFTPITSSHIAEFVAKEWTDD